MPARIEEFVFKTILGEPRLMGAPRMPTNLPPERRNQLRIRACPGAPPGCEPATELYFADTGESLREAESDPAKPRGDVTQRGTMPEMYTLPRSLVVDPLAQRRLKAELVMSFASGILYGETYRPVGLNALWSLAGVVASLEQSFAFEITQGTASASPGFMVGFEKGRFCFVGGFAREGIDVYTLTTVNLVGAGKVTFEDHRHGTFFWVPDRAMMSFEEIVRVGNSVLLSYDSHVRNLVGQQYSDWKDDRYRTEEDGDGKP